MLGLNRHWHVISSLPAAALLVPATLIDVSWGVWTQAASAWSSPPLVEFDIGEPCCARACATNLADLMRSRIAPVGPEAEIGKGHLVGDATSESEQPPSRETLPQGDLEPLDDDSLRRALYGNYVQRDMTGVYDAGGLEFFSSNGGWGELGGRAQFGGRFSVSDGAVCVDRHGGSTCCRRFYVDSSGEYFYALEPRSRHAGCYHYVVPEDDMSSLVPVAIYPRRTDPDRHRRGTSK